jgi:protein-S-isoprenylcysteine O-methyltransferase Ste14
LSKRISKKKTEKDHHDDFEIILADNPKMDPHNWNTSYRWFLTAFVGLLVLNATFASSAPSNLLPSIITYYGVSQLVGILTISLFVAGYMLGKSQLRLLLKDELIVTQAL